MTACVVRRPRDQKFVAVEVNESIVRLVGYLRRPRDQKFAAAEAAEGVEAEEVEAAEEAAAHHRQVQELSSWGVASLQAVGAATRLLRNLLRNSPERGTGNR